MLLSIGAKIPLGRIDKVHSRYDRTVNFEHEGGIVSIHTFPEPVSAYSIHLTPIDLTTLFSIERTTDNCLIINDSCTISVPEPAVYHGLAWMQQDLKLSPQPIDINPLCALLAAEITDNPLLVTLNRGTEPYSEGMFDQALEQYFAHAWQLWKEQEVTAAVSAFKGRGRGCTPAGDDFLCGLLLGLKVRERSEDRDLSMTIEQIYEAARGQSLIVNTLLEQSYRGWADSDYALLIHSLTNDNIGLSHATHKILQHGSTSGADSLLGFVSAWA